MLNKMQELIWIMPNKNFHWFDFYYPTIDQNPSKLPKTNNKFQLKRVIYNFAHSLI